VARHYKQRTLHTWKCRWRPNRKTARTFTPNDAARITCKVLRQGHTLAEIDERVAKICPEKDTKRSRISEEGAIQAVAQALLESNSVMDSAYTYFLAINGLLVAIAYLLRFVPVVPLRVASAAAAVTRTQIATVMTRIQVQRAANEATYNSIIQGLRRAA